MDTITSIDGYTINDVYSGGIGCLSFAWNYTQAQEIPTRCVEGEGRADISSGLGSNNFDHSHIACSIEFPLRGTTQPVPGRTRLLAWKLTASRTSNGHAGASESQFDHRQNSFTRAVIFLFGKQESSCCGLHSLLNSLDCGYELRLSTPDYTT